MMRFTVESIIRRSRTSVRKHASHAGSWIYVTPDAVSALGPISSELAYGARRGEEHHKGVLDFPTPR